MRCFADTSFYVAVVNNQDAIHRIAIDFVRQFRGRIIVTEYVLVELGNWLARTNDRSAFVRLNQQIQSDPKTLVVAADRALYVAGLGLYASRLDKDWSLTDCISFVVMRQFGLRDALTADRHFVQAGFNALLA
jgi:predicted nucleic acid-binding protein